MISNFWRKLPRPFLVLAPMEDVTDHAFREMFVSALPRPDVFFTEFTSADGLCSKGYDETVRRFRYSGAQRPIVAQIWGADPDTMYRAARIVKELDFDGIDINMGCPVPAVVKQGAGAGLIRDHVRAGEIIEAARRGGPDIPISVKTRLGYKSLETDTWIPFLLKHNLDALTIHGRTATQMSTGEVEWGEIAKCVEYRDAISPSTVIIGNGDILSYKQAVDAHKTTGVDGLMIGRGVFYNPWIFDRSLSPAAHAKDEYIQLLRIHLELFHETWGTTKNFQIMKKFFKMYVKGFGGANELRQRLMDCRSYKAVTAILDEIDQSF